MSNMQDMPLADDALEWFAYVAGLSEEVSRVNLPLEARRARERKSLPDGEAGAQEGPAVKPARKRAGKASPRQATPEDSPVAL